MLLQAPPQKNEHGFTMVEMMVVVLIIGILAAIAIPLYLEQRKAAYESALQSDLRNIGAKVASTQNSTTGGFKTPAPISLKDPDLIDRKTEVSVHLSPGVAIAYEGDRDGFCIVGAHAGNPSNTWAYSYRDGGVVKSSTNCSAGLTPDFSGGPIAAPAPAPSPSATTAPTTPSPSPSPTTEERHTGDLYTDTPISPDNQCFPEMMTINRLFNESIVYRSPASMMLFAAWKVNDSDYWLDRYEAHPDYIKKMELYADLNATEKYVKDRPVLQAEYDRRNDEMNANYAKFPKELAMDNYNAVTFDYIRAGGSATATPNKAITDAFEAHRHLIHQWNYVQCAEYAYPGHPLHKDDR